MKRRASSFIPLVILVLALGLRISDPAPIEQARLLIFDSYQRLKPRIYDPAVPVKIIDIDDESLARHGQWPWPRTTMGRLIDRLTQMVRKPGAAASLMGGPAASGIGTFARRE